MDSHKDKVNRSYRAEEIMKKTARIPSGNFTVKELYILMKIYYYVENLNGPCPSEEELNIIDSL